MALRDVTLDPVSHDETTMSVIRANAIALAWLPAAGVLILMPFVLLWDTGRLGAGIERLTALPVLLPGLAAGIVVHELLHAAGFVAFGRVSWHDVRVGIHRRTLTPYAACLVPMRARGYRGAAMLPALVLGVVPGIIGLAFGIGWLAVAATVMLALAGGDLAAVWAIRRLPAGALVRDHPTRVGCTVVPNSGAVPE